MDSMFKESLKLWTGMVNPEAAVELTMASADLMMAGQKKVRDMAVQAVETSEVPSHKDVERLELQVSLAEQRAAACETRLAEAAEVLARVESRLAGVTAALQASQARVAELQRQLD